MASLRDIRMKIRSIKNIQKITKAMKMVAASKLKKVQDRVAAGKPYADKMRELVQQVSPYAADAEHPLLETRTVQTVGFVVLTGDKGMCGSSNNNVIRVAVGAIKRAEEAGGAVKIFAWGKKGMDYFTKRGYDVARSEILPSVGAGFAEIQASTRFITEWFTSGEVDEVRFVYNNFINVIRQVPKVEGFLPIQPEAAADPAAADPAAADAAAPARSTGESDYIFEPEATELLGNLIPRFVDNQIYQYLLESMTSDQGARMQAMSQATENAGELIDSLTLQYNKARQFAITKEMLEIVGGAEALKTVN